MGADSTVFDPPEGLFLLFDPHSDAKSPYMTTRPHAFRSAMATVIVPEGFRCDLASVPRWLFPVFDPRGKHQRAAVFHDAAYRSQYCTRFEADSLFRTIMALDGVPLWRRWTMWAGVRICGWRSWRRNRANLLGFRAQVHADG